MGIWKTLANMATYPLRHPTSSMRNMGTAAKTATVGGAVAYVGWEKLTTDKSVARIVGDAAVGKETINSVKDTVSDVKQLKNKAGEAIDTISDAMTDVDSKWSGMSKFVRGLFGGEGLGMFGNFFRNLGNGDVSGLSIAGLVAAGFMLFGRFGWMGKIVGAMLAMTMIGNNSSLALQNTNKEMLARREEEATQSRGRHT